MTENKLSGASPRRDRWFTTTHRDPRSSSPAVDDPVPHGAPFRTGRGLVPHGGATVKTPVAGSGVTISPGYGAGRTRCKNRRGDTDSPAARPWSS
jgi:hypothetical protein